MRFAVNLNKCENHGQCSFSAPALFSLDEDGELSFRKLAEDEYLSDEIDQSTVDDVEAASDVCPVQAIRFVS